MNDHKLVGLADAVRPTDGVNKKVLDEAVKSLTRESQRYTNNLIVQTNESIIEKFERIEASIAVINGRIVTNTETDELKETILNQKIDRIEQNFVQRMNDLEFQFSKLQEWAKKVFRIKMNYCGMPDNSDTKKNSFPSMANTKT